MAFERPRKAILTTAHLAKFQGSDTYEHIVAYINALNDAVTGVKSTDPCSQSGGVLAILNLLDRVEDIARSTPPVNNLASRFGNPAFKEFYDKVTNESKSLHETLPNLPSESIAEVSVYFNESWGNRTRIDYGSGMELNFLCWMMCLEHFGVVEKSDHVALVIRVMWRYISVMRVLQSSYWLEPAGSHGVWGLDDYHFLPFLFGSAQLCGHKHIRPKAIHDSDILEEFSKYYMYLACIQFINSIKTASLRWHSPMLDDISAVKTWDKVNSGMIKMYKAEVLGKLPVMQHFLFGSILPFPGGDEDEDLHLHTEEEERDAHRGHRHVHSPLLGDTSGSGGGASQLEVGWGDCCGIPIPSAFAAAEADKKKNQSIGGIPFGGAIRPVPFD
ncbi:hypothetical protein BS47DRAFT_1315238 [Hydnum rufescens UP504]|uniref:Serine/threonine-protein phosphatase 2A activator n=1 Tax=Hydnum rufescens UP504 TaxID=1448309 RepID=A0A9P6B2X1_9AGAM|nr:hypothetical protein BS47DRAFT_1315238 [Hydnum rufescens UP504]